MIFLISIKYLYDAFVFFLQARILRVIILVYNVDR